MFSAKDLFFTPTSGNYQVNNSLRFRASASAYLNRTPASAGSRTTWTWSGWVKRGAVPEDGTQFVLLGAASGSTGGDAIMFSDTNSFQVNIGLVGTSGGLVTTAKYRDPSAWYHFVVAVDTTQATNTNRVKIYVNGVQVTVFSTSNYPSLSANTQINNNQAQYISRHGYAPYNGYFDGYLAEVNFIDGQALTPSSFGTNDPATGVWVASRYTGTYGTNGFYLPFSDTSGATATTIGKDSSGNGNNWTPNNISVTSGVTYDAMIDAPNIYAFSATQGVGNYAVFNPIVPSTGSISNGNLYVSTTTVNATSGTILQTTGKWYSEVYINSNGGNNSYIRIGVCNSAGVGADLGGSANGWAYLGDARVYNNGSTTSYGVTSTTGDTINIALDLDNGKVWYGKNGTWMASGNPATGANPSQTFTANQSMTFAVAAGAGTPQYYINFGQRPFAQSVPSGFSALNTSNLPTPTIANGAQYMAAVLYNGTSASNTVTTTSSNSGNNPLGKTFQPDLVWIKSRSAATDHKWTDAVRGTTKALVSNSTAAETTDTNGLTAFTSSGFTVGSDSNYNNGTGPATYVAWEWLAGNGTVSNTSGSITSTVSANTSAGFSVVTYTGNGTTGATVGHGLGVIPSMVIVKERGNVNGWYVYHTSLGNTKCVYLDSTSAQATVSIWNNTTPTSSLITYNNGVEVNRSSGTYVAYCFAPVAGYSAFGSLTSNGVAGDGVFVYLGFRPRWVLLKRTNTTGDWVLIDTTRNQYNVCDTLLYPNANYADTTLTLLDTLSNGFKIRAAVNALNNSGDTLIYAAFAENPFRYANAR